MSEAYLAIQVVMMPRDVNPNGAIFGGVILSYIDQAGAIGARREVMIAGGAPPMLATVAVNRVEFKRPVLVGDVVRFLTRRVRIGRTSITMQVSVEAQRGTETLHVTEAELVYVGLDPDGPTHRPRPLLG
jgi:acyl-CoA thioesterase YciA